MNKSVPLIHSILILASLWSFLFYQHSDIIIVFKVAKYKIIIKFEYAIQKLSDDFTEKTICIVLGTDNILLQILKLNVLECGLVYYAVNYASC